MTNTNSNGRLSILSAVAGFNARLGRPLKSLDKNKVAATRNRGDSAPAPTWPRAALRKAISDALHTCELF